jgi:ankyrin repeat protein
MPRRLPARPSLEHLKKQAKDLLKEIERNDADAIRRVREIEPAVATASIQLADAQRVIAREYGFANWTELKHHVEAAAPPVDPWESVAAAARANDAERMRAVLDDHPELRARLDDALPGYEFGDTALLVAVRNRNRDMVDVLLEAGADIDARTHWWAGSFGVLDFDSPLVSYLIERGATVNAHAAARHGMLDRLEALLAADPSLVHARGGDGQTPLHVAATIPIAEALLARGANIDALDVDHESTPAQYLVREHTDVARYLVSRGCRTDVLLAAALGDLERVRRHLDEDPGCVRMTVSEESFPKRDFHSGGTVYTWTLGWNKSPHRVARDFGHEDVFRLLMERSPIELQFAVLGELGDEAALDRMRSEHPGLDRSLSDKEHRHLVNAAQDNNARAVRAMLRAGWPADARNASGATALHWAAWHGNAELVREILGAHPPLEVPDGEFQGTPFGWALHGSSNSWHKESGDYAATVEALLDAGAQAPVQTENTPATEAVRRVMRRRVGWT